LPRYPSINLSALAIPGALCCVRFRAQAYQPINAFLREVANLSGEFRRSVTHNPSLTFAATVGHICRAIRKLAAVATPEEATRPLWRGVRGELARGFWMPDEQGMVCAVDMAFMSTSRNRQTPVEYMQDAAPNVLWELQPKAESDSAYHRGADISMLSQFKGEEEGARACACVRWDVRLLSHSDPIALWFSTLSLSLSWL
jgi:hypothetical protein